jgi:hypothetical protein
MLTFFRRKIDFTGNNLFGILKNNSTFNLQYPNYDNQKINLAYRTISTLVHFFQLLFIE